MNNNINGGEKKRTDDTRPLLDLRRPADYTMVSEIIEVFVSRYPFLAVGTIGETILGKSIYVLKLGDESAEKSVMYVGAHHGMEWITTLILLRFINEYCEYLKSSGQVFGINMGSLFANRCIHVIPQLNADGADLQINGASKECPMYERLMRMSSGDFSRWQANARGVDLNHNYDAGFYEYKVLERTRGIGAGATRFSGEEPESEPESGALANYLRFNDKIRMVMTFHTQGEEIFYTSGGKAPEGGETIGRQLERMTGYKLSTPDGLASYGGLTDWYIKETGKPSFTIECGRGENPLPYRDYYSIYSSVRQMLFSAPLLI